MIIRKLEKKDFKPFLTLVNYFTKQINSVSKEDFNKYFEMIQNDYSKVYVIEENSEIIGTGKILIEHKFIHNLSKCGHIEDVVIDEKCRGKGYGKKLINFLLEKGNEEGCYKIILCSSLKNRSFYKKCGFKEKDIEMCKYIK